MTDGCTVSSRKAFPVTTTARKIPGGSWVVELDIDDAAAASLIAATGSRSGIGEAVCVALGFVVCRHEMHDEKHKAPSIKLMRSCAALFNFILPTMDNL